MLQKAGKNGDHVLSVYTNRYIPIDEAFLPLGSYQTGSFFFL